MIIRRFIAFFIDLNIGMGICYLLAMVFGEKDETYGGYMFKGTYAILIVFAILVIYFSIQEYYWGATLAKRLFKLKVVKADGSRLSMADAFKRHLPDAIEIYAIAIIGVFMVLLDKNHQRLGDKWAGTMVINR